MKYRPPIETRCGRVSTFTQPAALNLPRINIYADGDQVSVAATYSNGTSDPVLLVEVDLSGTRLGELVGRTYWRIVKWRRR